METKNGCLDCLHPVCEDHWDRYKACIRQRSHALVDLSNMLPLYQYYRQRDEFDHWRHTSKEAGDMRAIYESMLMDFISKHEAFIDAEEER